MNSPVVTDGGRIECHECGESFENVGYHWSVGDCEYPRIGADVEALSSGLVLGAGIVRTHTSSPFVQVYSSRREFLEWLDGEFGWLSTGVSLYRSGKKSAEFGKENGHSVDEDSYHDVYSLRTRSLPQFGRYLDWDDGVPSYVVMVPRMARVMYATSGSLNWDRRYPDSRPYATINGSCEDTGRLLDESAFVGDVVDEVDQVRLSTDDTEAFLDWIGEPVPGYEYKWEMDDIDRYDELRAYDT